MADFKVAVYTTTHCPSCQTLKKWLTEKGVAFETVNIEEEPQKQQQLIEKSGSFLVPITIIEAADGQEEIVHGTQYAQIKKALNLD